MARAREKGLLDIHYHNFHDAEKVRHVDVDRPYSGQDSCSRAQPVDALMRLKKNPRVILLDLLGEAV